jgi:Enoyl-CoA hydratase/isomerase
MIAYFDHLTTDRFSALGDVPVLVVEAATWRAPKVPIRSVIIGVDRDGSLPTSNAGPFDVLLTSATDAPAPWVSCNQINAEIERLTGSIRDWPMAATMLCRVLRLGDGLSFEARLEIESMAYSTLLGGGEFARWLSARPVQAQDDSASPLLQIERDGDHVKLTLNDPDSQNAMTAAMRDALYAALATVLDDPSGPRVSIHGAGRCFSTGGALGEFGGAVDLAQAHMVRSIRSVSGLLDRLGERASVHVHGACIGSGLEIAAAAAHRSAAPDSWFQLPELHMGLIPGAGGSASVTQRIGRHRTVWLVLSGKRINAAQALNWGLIDAIA